MLVGWVCVSGALCCAGQDLLALARATTCFWNLTVAGVKGWQLVLLGIDEVWQQIMVDSFSKQTR